MSTRARLCHAATLGSWFGILLLLPLWYGWLAPPRLVPPAVAILALGIPLFAPLRGLLHGRRYTVAWSLFLALLYFAHGITEAWSSPAARVPALVEVSLSLCWMIAGTCYLRSSREDDADSGVQQG